MRRPLAWGEGAGGSQGGLKGGALAISASAPRMGSPARFAGGGRCVSGGCGRREKGPTGGPGGSARATRARGEPTDARGPVGRRCGTEAGNACGRRGCGRWRVLGRALLKRKAGARAWAECVGAGWAAREDWAVGLVTGPRWFGVWAPFLIPFPFLFLFQTTPKLN